MIWSYPVPMVPKLFAIAAVLLATAFAVAQSTTSNARPRTSDLGLKVGILPAGPLDAITDVAGVEVGQATIIRGDNIRTGVTAVLPHSGNLYREKAARAWLGVARTGSSASNGSGDYAIAFSTCAECADPCQRQSPDPQCRGDDQRRNVAAVSARNRSHGGIGIQLHVQSDDHDRQRTHGRGSPD